MNKVEILKSEKNVLDVKNDVPFPSHAHPRTAGPWLWLVGQPRDSRKPQPSQSLLQITAPVLWPDVPDPALLLGLQALPTNFAAGSRTILRNGTSS